MGRGAFSVRFLVMFDNVDFNRQLIKHNFNITLFVKELIFTNINFRKRCYVGQAHIARIAKELSASVAFRARMPFGNAAQEGIVGDSHFSEWIGFADKSIGGCFIICTVCVYLGHVFRFKLKTKKNSRKSALIHRSIKKNNQNNNRENSTSHSRGYLFIEMESMESGLFGFLHLDYPRFIGKSLMGEHNDFKFY